jgi:hypothetical protein
MNRLLRNGLGAALSLTLAALTASDARAQQPGSASAAAWYSYVPGEGWVSYAPASAPVVSPAALAVAVASTPTTIAGGWAGYAPAQAWAGYVAASNAGSWTPLESSRPLSVTQDGRLVLPADGSRRHAANLFVNHNRPELALSYPAYHEAGTGRPVPLAKPWLPLQP